MDVWKICEMGHIHWGRAGAAGFLFRYSPGTDELSVLLQQRPTSVNCPGTWGIPGEAIRDGESPEAAAKREFEEEIGRLPSFAGRRKGTKAIAYWKNRVSNGQTL